MMVDEADECAQCLTVSRAGNAMLAGSKAKKYHQPLAQPPFINSHCTDTHTLSHTHLLAAGEPQCWLEDSLALGLLRTAPCLRAHPIPSHPSHGTMGKNCGQPTP